MLEQKLSIPLDHDMARIAAGVLLLGIVIAYFVGWLVAGLALAAFGAVCFWLAHQLAIAPCCDRMER
jgi:hypothetical protein